MSSQNRNETTTNKIAFILSEIRRLERRNEILREENEELEKAVKEKTETLRMLQAQLAKVSAAEDSSEDNKMKKKQVEGGIAE